MAKQHLPGVFTMSFDCEGLWGPSTLTPFLRERITEERLRDVYQRMVDMLDRYELKATFAFVGLFTLTPDEVLGHPQWYETASGQQWPRTAEFLDAVRAGRSSGWLSPASFDIVQRSGRHELATHGFQHLAIQDQQLTQQDFERELQRVAEVGRMRGYVPRTLIYPRNQVRFTELLRSYGIDGYREFIGMRRLPIPVGENVQLKFDALAALAREVDLWAQPHQHSERLGCCEYFGSGSRETSEFVEETELLRVQLPINSQPHVDDANSVPIKIPAGYFFNWRVGLRRRIPTSITIARWSNLLQRASRKGGMVHLWAHPHNFITGSQQLECFEAVLKVASERVKNGEILNLTQAEYCDKFINTGVDLQSQKSLQFKAA